MKVVIVGAGITGLTAAYDLIKSGHQVTVYEAQPTAGGLAGGFQEPHWDSFVEYYYHHWFASDKAILNLIKELGWRSDLRFITPKTVVFHRHAFYPLDSVRAILKFPGFTLLDILRFGFVTAYVKYLARWQPLEKVTAVTWLKRWYGPHLYKIIWEPMLQGKFNTYYHQVNMAWMWARLKARTGTLVTFKGGFQTFINRFITTLKSQGVDFHFNTPITSLTATKSGVAVKTQKHTSNFDVALVTLSPAGFTHLVKNIPPSFEASLKSSRHLGATVLLLSLKHQLSSKGYYWFNLPKKSGFPFLALVEHTNFIHPPDVGGDHLVYCGDYCLPTDPRLKQSAATLLKTYTPALKRINPRFKSSWVKKAWHFATPYAQPIPFRNHSHALPPLKTPLPHLYFASMSHIYPWDRGTNFAVSLGHQVARLIKQDA